MIKGQNINGYHILEDFKVAGGMSKVSFARKGDKEYFIKEFLYPKYPTPESPGSESVKAKKRKACEVFEKHHRDINNKISSKCSLGGNLVFAVDFFRSGPCYYKINERIDTSSISCSEISKLPAEKILIIVKSVCHSVQILHDLKIVHGDLKPDNILIKKTSAGYSGKLIDFDDSYFDGNPPSDRECVVGTPDYYSPEQAAYIMDEDEEIPGSTLTCKSDIFTLGIIFTEYFTGEKPIVSKGSVWSAVKRGETPSFFKPLKANLKKLLLEMLSLDSTSRPGIKEVFERFRNIDKEPSGLSGDKHTTKDLVESAPTLRGRGLSPTRVKSGVIPPHKELTPASTGSGLRGKGLEIAKKK